MDFIVLNTFVNLISEGCSVNQQRLNEYKKFVENNALSILIKLKTARHHILPKSEAKRLGIDKVIYNSDCNIVILSHKNHAIAHILLALAIPTKRMCWMVKSMFRMNELSYTEIINGDFNILSDDYALIMEQSNKFISEALTGRKVSDETRQKNSIGRLGKRDSQESRKKKSDARLGMKVSDDTRAKHRRENLSAESRRRLSEGHNPMPEEEKEIRRQRMRGVMTGRPKSETQKEKLSNAIRGRHWYNNGVVQIQIHGDPPEGFSYGLLQVNVEKKNGNKSNTGLMVWSDGEVERHCIECPEGFMRGSKRTVRRKLREGASPLLFD